MAPQSIEKMVLGKVSPKWRNISVDSYSSPMEKQAPQALKDFTTKSTSERFV